MSKKTIIVFEGIEGTGKSHHINNVAKYLKKNNKKFAILLIWWDLPVPSIPSNTIIEFLDIAPNQKINWFD